MQNVRALVAVAAVAMSSAGAHATSWVEIGSTPGQKSATVSFDYESLRKQSGGVVRVWVQFSYLELQPADAIHGKPFQTAVQQLLLRCKDETFALVNYALYSEPKSGGDLVFSSPQTPQDQLKFNSAYPESIGGALLHMVCPEPASKK